MIKRIEMRLKELGMSKAEFYSKSGISSASFSQWRTGVHEPTKDKIVAAAAAINVTVDYLLGNEEKEKTPEPKTERELIISEIMAFVDTLSDEDLKSFYRLIVK